MTTEQWKTVAIEELYSGLFDGPHATPRPSDSGPVFLGIGNVTDDGRLDLTEIRHISDDEFPRWTKRVLPMEGDIVFTYEATLNRYARIPRDFRGCLGRRMALIRPDDSKADRGFLFYYFFTPAWRRVIASNLLVGSTVDRIPLTRFPSFPVRVPPLSLQRRIASILSAYDDLIENNQRRIRILNEMARLIYREWFVAFRFPGWETAAFVESAIGVVPAGWEILAVTELISEHIGGGWGVDRPSNGYCDPAWVIRGTDIPAARHCDIRGLPYRYHKTSQLLSRTLAAGDIVFETSGGSKGQPVGRTLLINQQLLDVLVGPAMCASFCKRVRTNRSRYEPELMYLSLLEAYDNGELEQYQIQSTGISNFKWSEYIDNALRAVPPKEIRVAFVDLVRPIFALIATLGRQITALRDTRDILLPLIVSGEVEVSRFRLADIR